MNAVVEETDKVLDRLIDDLHKEKEELAKFAQQIKEWNRTLNNSSTAGEKEPRERG